MKAILKLNGRPHIVLAIGAIGFLVYAYCLAIKLFLIPSLCCYEYYGVGCYQKKNNS